MLKLLVSNHCIVDATVPKNPGYFREHDCIYPFYTPILGSNPLGQLSTC